MHVQMAEARAAMREAERQRKAAREAKAKAVQNGESGITAAPTTATAVAPDGQPCKRTLVVCPLAVVSLHNML